MGASVAVATMDGVTLGTATLEVNKPMAVSSYGGTIESVHTQVGKNVKRGETLFKLTDSPITLKLENLRLQRETANKSLEEAKEQRENLIVIRAVRRHDRHAQCQRRRRNHKRRAHRIDSGRRRYEPDHRRG